MELAKFRRLCRVTFFLGAMLMFFGLGVYIMGHMWAGVGLLITGMVISALCFTVTYTFMQYDFKNAPRKRRSEPKKPEE